jgi:hypothetical protein
MTKNEQIVYNKCQKIYEKIDETGICLFITYILFEYFKEKDINVKVHIGFFHKKDQYDKIEPPIIHNWISYNSKKCDITAHFQQEGYSSAIYILDEIIGRTNPNVNLVLINKNNAELYKDLVKKWEQTQPILYKIAYTMIEKAAKSNDSSFLIEDINKYFDEGFYKRIEFIKSK